MIVVEDTVSLIYEDMKYVLQISQAGGESDSTIPVGTHGIFYLRAVSPSGQISADYVEARVCTSPSCPEHREALQEMGN